MKRKNSNSYLLSCLFLSIFHWQTYTSAKHELQRMYEHHCRESSDINEHVHVLRQVAMECSTVMELGLRDMNSTWGILQGLAENSSTIRSYTGVDLAVPPASTLGLARKLAEENGISFKFWHINDMDITIEDVNPVDMLFIDTMHTYCHLTYELEKFCNKVRKYITMHDTDEPWGFINDFQQYFGDYSEYPAHFDRTKKGLWAAVEDFLTRHPEWTLHERRRNNHGFTILKRIMD